MRLLNVSSALRSNLKFEMGGLVDSGATVAYASKNVWSTTAIIYSMQHVGSHRYTVKYAICEDPQDAC